MASRIIFAPDRQESKQESGSGFSGWGEAPQEQIKTGHQDEVDQGREEKPLGEAQRWMTDPMRAELSIMPR